MSGGYFDYNQFVLADISESIEDVISQNNMKEKDQYGDPVGFGFTDETIEQLKRASVMLDVASIYVQRIDWLLSGDDSEESFHKRLNEELEKYKLMKENG